jgi:hypothetical protein
MRKIFRWPLANSFSPVTQALKTMIGGLTDLRDGQKGNTT